jgi:thiosulfate/3-mercaptopyruvate sulfurtransferase
MDFTTLITPEELNPHLEDPNWAIFDVRFDLNDKKKGPQDYLKGHIPGAVYAHLEEDLSLPASPQGGRHPLPPVDALEHTLSQWGIDGGVQVVAYDDRGGGFAARLWWILRYLGHNRVALVDGGFPAWVHAGLLTQQGKESRTPRAFHAEVQDRMLARVEDVLRCIEDEGCLIIDSRTPERYQGLEEHIDRIAGHIPGAVNRYWQYNLDKDGHLLPKEVLHEEWKALIKDIPPQKTVVYCGSGVTGCFNIFAMTLAGFTGARLYDGSWSQWLEDQELPKVLGPQGKH